MIFYTAYSPTLTTTTIANFYWLVTHADSDKEIFQLITAKPVGEAFGDFIYWKQSGEN
jgi:hypothetical protein